MSSSRRKKVAGLLWIFATGTLLAIFISIFADFFLFHHQWEHHLLHSTLEAIGALAGIYVAIILLVHHRDNAEAVFRVWVPAGLLAMGILNGFHSSVPVSSPNLFVWLHSTAFLLGGAFFAVSWLPFRPSGVKTNVPAAFAVIISATLGAFSLLLSEIIPGIQSGVEFSLTARILNAASGILFIGASVLFLSRYIATRDSGEMIFCFYCSLNGIVGLSFGMSRLWDTSWWLWHIFSVASNLTLLVFVFTVFKSTDAKNKETTALLLAETAGHGKTLDALKLSEEKYRSLVENVKLGIFRSTPGPIGRFLEVNKTMESITGYSREELLRISVCSLYERPEDREAVNSKFASGDKRVTMETRLKRKDGTIKVVSETTTPVADASGEIQYFDGVLEDITERIQQEKSYRSIIETSIDGFWMADKQGNIIDINDAYCRMIGYDREELLHMKIRDVEAYESPEEVTDHIRAVIQNGSDRFETQQRCKNGKIIDVEISVHYSAGQEGRLFVFARDIAERKKTQQQLVVNDRLASIGLLVSGIVHEVGNPLTTVMGYLSLLLGEKLPNKVKNNLQIIDDETRRAANILRSLLSFSRQDSQEKQPLKVNEIIWRINELRTYDQKKKGVKVVLLLDPDLPAVFGNGSQLQQVFYNIVINAEYAMFEAHRVAL